MARTAQEIQAPGATCTCTSQMALQEISWLASTTSALQCRQVRFLKAFRLDLEPVRLYICFHSVTCTCAPLRVLLSRSVVAPVNVAPYLDLLELAVQVRCSSVLSRLASCRVTKSTLIRFWHSRMFLRMLASPRTGRHGTPWCQRA